MDQDLMAVLALMLVSGWIGWHIRRHYNTWYLERLLHRIKSSRNAGDDRG